MSLTVQTVSTHEREGVTVQIERSTWLLGDTQLQLRVSAGLLICDQPPASPLTFPSGR